MLGQVAQIYIIMLPWRLYNAEPPNSPNSRKTSFEKYSAAAGCSLQWHWQCIRPAKINYSTFALIFCYFFLPIFNCICPNKQIVFVPVSICSSISRVFFTVTLTVHPASQSYVFDLRTTFLLFAALVAFFRMNICLNS